MNGKMYCNLFSDGSIVELDANTGKMRQLNTTVISEPDCWSNGGMDYLYANGKLYIVENRRKKIACYDIRHDECNFYELAGKWYTLAVPNYTLATIFKDNIYIFPRFDKEIMIFSLTDNCMQDSLYLSIDDVSVPSNDMLEEDPVSADIFSNAKRLGENVFLTCDALQKIVVFNLKDGSILYKNYPRGLKQCIDLIIKDNIFYMLSLNGNVYFGDLCNEDFRQLVINKDNMEFRRILVTDKNICWLPGKGEDILLYNLEDECMYIYNNYPRDFVYALRCPEMAKFFARCEDDDWYYMAMCTQNYMLKVSKRTGQLVWIKPKGISHDEKMRFYVQKKVLVINESSEYDIYDFLKYKVGEHSSQLEVCGKSIYDAVKSE